jgi:hypothetical protein
VPCSKSKISSNNKKRLSPKPVQQMANEKCFLWSHEWRSPVCSDSFMILFELLRNMFPIITKHWRIFFWRDDYHMKLSLGKSDLMLHLLRLYLLLPRFLRYHSKAQVRWMLWIELNFKLYFYFLYNK